MRVLTLNIRHGGGSRGRALVKFLSAQAADVIVLTEYRENSTGQSMLAALAQHGYQCQANAARDTKANSVCIVSRIAFRQIRFNEGDFQELHRILAVRFENVTVTGVYFPLNEAKRPVFKWLRESVLPQLGNNALIIGDFNTGKAFEDEAGDTFACKDCFDELLAAGLTDSWRQRNPKSREFSWFSRVKNGFRIDHALATQAFDRSICSIEYLHEPRLSKITDHSALTLCSDG